jgi:hypothetical protein
MTEETRLCIAVGSIVDQAYALPTAEMLIVMAGLLRLAAEALRVHLIEEHGFNTSREEPPTDAQCAEVEALRQAVDVAFRITYRQREKLDAIRRAGGR